MGKKPPHFMIIGAMKCATSTMHEQLAAQPGIFMTEPKEPNFFSNDEIYSQGLDWYANLFAEAMPEDICGESSTHYTKLPTYPETIARIKAYAPDVKLIYMMRHPVDRLVSQYIHEWTQCLVSNDINQAIYEFPPLIAYSRYSMQLAPFIQAFGAENVLPIFLEKVKQNPQAELEKVAKFIGYSQHPVWSDTVAQQNSSADRTRKSAWRDFIVDAPVLSDLRRAVVPKSVRNWVRSLWQMKTRPELTPESRAYIEQIVDADLAILGSWLGLDLTCQNFKTAVLDSPETWTEAVELPVA